MKMGAEIPPETSTDTRWRRVDGHISEFSPVRLVKVRVCNITASKRGLDAILTPV
jgi:hypothetical protein